MTAPMLEELPHPPPGRTGWPWDIPAEHRPEPALDGRLWPRIAIVTPSFNQAAFIEETLRSVLLQGYPNLEYRVLDGGSRDGSVEIIRKYEPWLTGWSSGPDRGQSDAINTGIGRSSFDLGSWLNSDDLLLPGALLAVASHRALDPRCEFVTGDGVFVDPTGRTELYYKRSAPYTFQDLLQYATDLYLPQPSVFFSKALFERVGGLDTTLRYTMDLDLWLRMRTATDLHYVPTRLSLLRQHKDAKTVRDNEDAVREAETVLRRHARRAPLRVRASTLRSIRSLRARSACATALNAYFAGDRRAAWRGIARAVRTYAPIVATRPMARVALRLALPDWIKSGLFLHP
jgi:glycosyltransferase involved in cell wall biosynthesis